MFKSKQHILFALRGMISLAEMNNDIETYLFLSEVVEYIEKNVPDDKPTP